MQLPRAAGRLLDNNAPIPADLSALARDVGIQFGDDLCLRFNAGKNDQFWCHRSLVQAFREARATGYLFEEFDRVVSEIESLAGHT